MVRLLAKVLKILASETEPGQIGLAASFAVVAGLTPLFSLHNILVLFLVLVLRVNLLTFILGTVLFAAVGSLLETVCSWLGLALLTAQPLERLWTRLYQSPLWRLEDFNNSVVMGSLAISFVFFLPVGLLTTSLIRRHRERLLARVRLMRPTQILRGSRFHSAYQAVSGWGR
ncbi:MAG TPA: TIGR03546 family protein [Syntrophobacteria bacterium]|nr:TIGR03546 family protein [Syntrophobacteria bacterium]